MIIGYKKKYFIQYHGQEKEVSEKEFIEVERAAGFYPKRGCGPVATGGFSGRYGLCGRVEYTKECPNCGRLFHGGEE